MKKRKNPLLENEGLKELFIELVTIKSAFKIEKLSYINFASPKSKGIKIVMAENVVNNIAEKYPGIYTDKKNYKCSGGEYGVTYEIDFSNNKTKEYCKNFNTWEMSSQFWENTASFTWRNSETRMRYAFPVLWSNNAQKTGDYVCLQTYSYGQQFSSQIHAVELSTFNKYLDAATQWLEPERVNIDTLLKILEKGDSGEKEFAIKMLGKKKSIKSISIIKKYLKSKDYCLREAAFYALGMIGNTEAIDILQKIMNTKDEHYNYKFKAIEALSMIKSKETLPIFKRLMKDKKAFIRAKTASAIGESTDKGQAITILLPYFSDKDINVRHAVIDALHKLGWKAK